LGIRSSLNGRTKQGQGQLNFEDLANGVPGGARRSNEKFATLYEAQRDSYVSSVVEIATHLQQSKQQLSLNMYRNKIFVSRPIPSDFQIKMENADWLFLQGDKGESSGGTYSLRDTK